MKKLISILLTITMMATMMSPVLASGNSATPAIGQPGNLGQISGLVNKVLGAIQWVGYAFALGMLLYIGIKYMMSAANEKADLKKGLINYFIGAVILFAASTIVGAIKGWV